MNDKDLQELINRIIKVENEIRMLEDKQVNIRKELNDLNHSAGDVFNIVWQMMDELRRNISSLTKYLLLIYGAIGLALFYLFIYWLYG